MQLLSDQPKLLFQKGDTEIEYLERHNAICLSWAGKVTPSDYTFTLMELLKLIRKHKPDFLLMDARDSDKVKRGPWDWTAKYISEELTNTSIRKIARIGCGYLMEEAIVSSRLTSIFNKLNFQFRYVADMNEALEWFLQDGENNRPNKDC